MRWSCSCRDNARRRFVFTMSTVYDLPHAHGAPPLTGVLRARPEDFLVDEALGFEASGTGDHVLVQVRKRGMNTPDVARILARHAGAASRDVGYAGLKDRHAVTSQWFSVPLAGKPEPDWSALNNEQLTVLAAQRHQRKLRRGALTGNRFSIVLREVHGDWAALPARLQKIIDEGVPNYFGEQRFGHDNVARARRMLAGELQVRDRFERGIYLSALRSYLFNAVLARRVAQDSWRSALAGEVMLLAGSRSFFVAETVDETLLRRLAEQDIHPSGPLWGRGESPARGAARSVEDAVLADYDEDREALVRGGLDMERRSLRLLPRGVEWSRDADDVLRVGFELPAGCYATVVLRELVNCPAAEG